MGALVQGVCGGGIRGGVEIARGRLAGVRGVVGVGQVVGLLVGDVDEHVAAGGIVQRGRRRGRGRHGPGTSSERLTRSRSWFDESVEECGKGVRGTGSARLAHFISARR